jgi:hypothetical protein
MSDADRRVSVDMAPLSRFGEDLWAVRVCNARTEFVTMDAVEMFRNCESDVKGCILDPRGGKELGLTALLEGDKEVYDGLLKEFEEKYGLNLDQVAVCRRVLESLGESCESPITLVHGGLLRGIILVFGAGKSFVISVLIILLHRLHKDGKLKSKSGPFRIVISSNTNGRMSYLLLY